MLAAADVYAAMTHTRPHRAALSSEAAAAEMRTLSGAGQLHRDAVEAVLVTAGHPRGAVVREWPSGLTEREIEVLRLICQGSTKKMVARLLSISTATVDHHVRHIYDKADVKTRAGTLAPDFELPGLDGGTARLSALRDHPVVLVFGSYTCPIFASRVAEMETLAADFPDAHFSYHLRTRSPSRRTAAATPLVR